MSKTILIILGILILLAGVVNLFSATLLSGLSTTWHGIIKVVIALIAIYVGATDKK
jgi:uncharacterized membrane protein